MTTIRLHPLYIESIVQFYVPLESQETRTFRSFFFICWCSSDCWLLVTCQFVERHYLYSIIIAVSLFSCPNEYLIAWSSSLRLMWSQLMISCDTWCRFMTWYHVMLIPAGDIIPSEMTSPVIERTPTDIPLDSFVFFFSDVGVVVWLHRSLDAISLSDQEMMWRYVGHFVWCSCVSSSFHHLLLLWCLKSWSRWWSLCLTLKWAGASEGCQRHAIFIHFVKRDDIIFIECPYLDG